MVLAPPKELPKPKGKAQKRRGAIGRQPDLFSGAMQQPIYRQNPMVLRIRPK
jgi:hypothetical protein